MNIRRVLFLIIFSISVPVLADTPTQSQFWACPREFIGQTLNVYNWTTYIAEDTISNFERLCGVSVNYNTYASDTDMLDELREGNPGYDIVVPSNSTVYLMVEENLLQTLDFAHIPNYANINGDFKNPPHDPNNLYTVPYQWGTIGIGYNRTKVGMDITSWNDVFTYPGKIAWLDEYRAMYGFALLMLGYDPNTSNTAEIEAATQYLISSGANVAEIAPDTGQDLLAAGAVDIVIEYSGDIYQLIASCECDDFRYIIPNEGAQIWTDSLAIPVGAPNKALAEVFIDYVLHAQVGADISNYTAYASPNQTAISEGLISLEYLTNSAIYPDSALISKLFYNVSSSNLEELYSTAWDNVITVVAK